MASEKKTSKNAAYDRLRAALKAQTTARAYLFYKLVFFIAGAIVLLILIWIGLGLLDQLLAYMEML